MLIYLCMYLPVKLRGEGGEDRGSPSDVSETGYCNLHFEETETGLSQGVSGDPRGERQEGVRESLIGQAPLPFRWGQGQGWVQEVSGSL